MPSPIAITHLTTNDISITPPSHHIGNPPTSFKNPWPSANSNSQSLLNVLAHRLGHGSEKPNFIPIPADRAGLPNVIKPTWALDKTDKLRATWFGHASFHIETPAIPGMDRGLRILLDPVFAAQMGPWARLGPKRFTPLPCSLDDVPDVDLVLISHAHYDHCDVDAIRAVHARRGENVHFMCGLNGKAWFVSCGVPAGQVTEMDWWDEVNVNVGNVGNVKIVCTPAQHTSARTPTDKDKWLWCGWLVQTSVPVSSDNNTPELVVDIKYKDKTLFFAGDTGYRSINPLANGELPTACPAFAEIGAKYGPVDLALLPIGCFLPRSFMSAIHSAPEDAVSIHQDVKSKRSIGMHWGTIRGGISGQYEEVGLPARRFKEKAEEAGLRWGEEIDVCDVGETVCV